MVASGAVSLSRSKSTPVDCGIGTLWRSHRKIMYRKRGFEKPNQCGRPVSLWRGVMSREEVGMGTLAPGLEHMDDRTKLIGKYWYIGSLVDPKRMM
jgi:hypothetical protein